MVSECKKINTEDTEKDTYEMTIGKNKYTVIFEYGEEPYENFLKLLLEKED